MMRGAHVGEVVPIRVDRSGGLRLLPKKARHGANGSDLSLSKESYLLHTDVVLGVGGIHHPGSQLDFEDAFNLQNEPPAPNTPPIYRNVRHSQIGTCVLLNDVGKMMFNNNAATEAEALQGAAPLGVGVLLCPSSGASDVRRSVPRAPRSSR